MRVINVYGRVLRLLGGDLKVAILLAVANLVVAGLQFLDPLLFGRVIGLLARSTDLPPDSLWTQAATLLAIWAGVGATGILANIFVAVQAERLAHRNRLAAMGRYYDHVLALPLSFHGDTQSGRLIKMMVTGSDGLFWAWLTFFREQFSTFVSTLVLLPLTMFLNWRLASALVVLVIAFVGITLAIVKRTEAGQRQVETTNSTLFGTAQDALANVMVVQSFTRLGHESRRFGDLARTLMSQQFPVLNWWAVVNVLTRASSTIAVIAIVLIGTLLHVQGQAAVGDIVAFMGFATLLIGRLESAVQFTSRLFMQIPSLEDFFATLDARGAVPEREDAQALVVDHGEVAFEDVSFAYPGGPHILSHVSFVAQPGTSVALVGQTGAGKSTAMALLQRLWDPSSGRVAIDGQDLRDVTLDSLRKTIGVVFQDSMLFNRTIRDNVAIGRPEASTAEIEDACRQADAHDFIVRQPQGYDTMVGERGATLSGGQKQRLAIARALLKNPPILILDEATSALDAATEAKVGRALATLMRGRTTFIIAHRLSTVRDADEILVFDQGEIVERGSFDSLVSRGGRFSELVRTQLMSATPLRAAAE